MGAIETKAAANGIILVTRFWWIPVKLKPWPKQRPNM